MTDLQPRPGLSSPEPGTEAAVIRREARDRRRSRKRATGVYVVVSLVFVALLGGLAYAGYHASRRVRGGFTTHRIVDPTAPGYEVAVLPTPVHLAAVVDSAGKLVDYYVFIGSTSGKGGTVLWIVGDVAVEVEGKPLQSLDAIYDGDGPDAAREQVERLLGLGVTDSITLDPDRLEKFLTPAGKLTIENPDPLFTLDGGVRKEVYPAGTLHLSPSETAALLVLRSNGEVATNRATRASLVMDAYFKELASVSVPATPDLTTDKGADLLVAAGDMSAGPTGFEILPVSDQPLGADRYFTPDPTRIETLMGTLVPFPASAFPGQRPRVRIVASTTNRDAPAAASPSVVAAGGEILVIGNANGTVGATTVVEYHAEAMQAAAQKIAARFGVTAVASSDQTETYDVTVTLGNDYHG